MPLSAQHLTVSTMLCALKEGCSCRQWPFNLSHKPAWRSCNILTVHVSLCTGGGGPGAAAVPGGAGRVGPPVVAGAPGVAPRRPPGANENEKNNMTVDLSCNVASVGQRQKLSNLHVGAQTRRPAVCDLQRFDELGSTTPADKSPPYTSTWCGVPGSSTPGSMYWILPLTA